MQIAFFQVEFPRITEAYLLDQIIALIKSGHKVDIISTIRSDQTKIHPDITTYNLEASTRYLNFPFGRWHQILNAVKLVIQNFHKAPLTILKSLNFLGYDCPTVDIYLRVIHATVLFVCTNNTKYDILYCCQGYTGSTVVALRQLGLVQGKIITTYPSSDIYVYPHKFKYDVYASLWKYCDLHHCNTNYVANSIKDLGANPSSIKVLPLGVDISKFPFKERTLDPNSPIKILTVARLVPKKGLQYSIRAFHQACQANPSANLIYNIVGEGPERPKLESLIKELDMGDHEVALRDRIFLLGWKDRNECKELYLDAHFYVIPSVTADDGNKEGQGVALQEAQATGLPLIATDHNGFPEGLLEGKSGYLVPEKDVDALAKMITKLVNSPDSWAEMGRAGRHFVENKYSVEKINREFVEICTSLVNNDE